MQVHTFVYLWTCIHTSVIENSQNTVRAYFKLWRCRKCEVIAKQTNLFSTPTERKDTKSHEVSVHSRASAVLLCSSSDIRAIAQGSTVRAVYTPPYILQLFQKFLVSGISLYFPICCKVWSYLCSVGPKRCQQLVYVLSKCLYEEGSTVQLGSRGTERWREMWKVSQEISGKGGDKSWDMVSRLPEMPKEVSLLLPTTHTFSASLFSWYYQLYGYVVSQIIPLIHLEIIFVWL